MKLLAGDGRCGLDTAFGLTRAVPYEYDEGGNRTREITNSRCGRYRTASDVCLELTQYVDDEQ